MSFAFSVHFFRVHPLFVCVCAPCFCSVVYRDSSFKLSTGDVVTVSGVVKSVNAELASGRMNKRAKASGLYLIYLEANALVNSRQVGEAGRWGKWRAEGREGGGSCTRVFTVCNREMAFT